MSKLKIKSNTKAGAYTTRSIVELANATPKDYLEAAPKDPQALALMMIEKARRLYPIADRDDGVAREQNYCFLFVGPGAGVVIDTLINQGHRAFGMESSRRGIMSAPDEIRGYVSWVKPWESNFPSKQGEHPIPFKMFHVALINKYLKTYYTEAEWEATLTEVKKLAKYAALI